MCEADRLSMEGQIEKVAKQRMEGGIWSIFSVNPPSNTEHFLGFLEDK